MRLGTGAVVCLVALSSVAVPGAARADAPLPSAADEARLEAGETLVYPETQYEHGRRYVGGVSYTVVDASARELTGLLGDVSAYIAVLPHAKSATIVDRIGDDTLVEIRQGTGFVEAAYTLRMRLDADGRRVRFWLDRSRPHAIDDAWGYFRVEPIQDKSDGGPRVLLSYGILVDLGPGIMRDFFESRIQASMLSVPERLRRYAFTRFRAVAAKPPA
jgi:hypothetical protein